MLTKPPTSAAVAASPSKIVGPHFLDAVHAQQPRLGHVVVITAALVICPWPAKKVVHPRRAMGCHVTFASRLGVGRHHRLQGIEICLPAPMRLWSPPEWRER